MYCQVACYYLLGFHPHCLFSCPPSLVHDNFPDIVWRRGSHSTLPVSFVECLIKEEFLLCRLFGSSTFVSSSILGKQNTLPSPYRSFLVTSRRWSTGCHTCQLCQCWASSCSLLWVRARFHGWSLPNSSPRVHVLLPCPSLYLSTGQPTSLLVLASQPWRYCVPCDVKCLLWFHIVSSYHILKQLTCHQFSNSIRHLMCHLYSGDGCFESESWKWLS